MKGKAKNLIYFSLFVQTGTKLNPKNDTRIIHNTVDTKKKLRAEYNSCALELNRIESLYFNTSF